MKSERTNKIIDNKGKIISFFINTGYKIYPLLDILFISSNGKINPKPNRTTTVKIFISNWLFHAFVPNETFCGKNAITAQVKDRIKQNQPTISERVRFFINIKLELNSS